MSYTTITVAHDQGLATLTLNAPDKLNAVSRKMIAELKDCWETLAADGSVRAVLLTGAGRGFCAGADLSDPDRGKEGGDSGSALDKFFNPVIRLMRSVPKPIVGAINGVAAGGGANFALACDIVLAARSARFDQAFVRISLMPDLGGTWFLPRTVGDARARGLAMLGKSVPAEEAERMGMIWQTVDDEALMAEATRFARQLAGGPTLSYAAIKKAINAAATNTLDQQLDLERDSQRDLGRSADFKEGVSAFLAKRPAAFTGR